jgi:hypothetical protein
MPHKRIRWSWISIVPLAITLARPTRSALQAHEEKRRAAIAMESLRKFIPGPAILPYEVRRAVSIVFDRSSGSVAIRHFEF